MLEPQTGWAWRLFLLCLLSASAWAEPFSGSVFEAGTGRKQALFSLKRIEKQEPGGLLKLVGIYATPEGKEAIREEAWVRQGKLQKYVQEQRQLGEWGTMEVRGDRLHFEWARGSSVDQSEEDVPSNLIVSATLVDYLHEHWDALLEGKEIGARMAVLDRQETIGFKFYVSRREKDLLHVTMKPTSVFVSLAFKPIEMVFERKSKRLVELKGKVGLKKRAGNGWEDLDAEMVYLY
jgi:hypothetical protein